MRVSPSNINAFLFTPNKYFDIPDFQRPYSWDPQNVHAFLSDLEEVKKTGKQHYFGNVVYISNGPESTIIDGQQRATTALLMIMAIYHIVHKDSSRSAKPSDQINESFLFNKFGEQKNRIKLRTVTVDNTIFEKIYKSDMQDSSLTAKEKTSKLFAAYKIFYDYLSKKNGLHEYIDALEKFEIVDLSLEPSDDNPQRVFESINSTGRPLTDGDKIRNFALMLNDKEMRNFVFENYWQSIEQELTDINEDYITDFFRNYLISRQQKEVNLNQVYPRFKALFNEVIGNNQSDKKTIKSFYDHVVLYLNHYIFLKFNRDPNNEFRFIHESAFRLNYIQIETPFPFLLSVLDSYKKGVLDHGQTAEIFSIIEVYLARRIICNVPTTGLNKFFAVLHRDIESILEENSNTNYLEVFKFILLDKAQSLRIPVDKEIESNIKNNQFYTQRKLYVNFVLSSVEDRAQKKEAFLLRQIARHQSDLSIEHIMPQTLNKKWVKELGDDYAETHVQYVHTLPNLTLTGYNSKYSNRSFKDKKSIENGFNDSPLILNQYVKKFDTWDKKSLEKRARWWQRHIETIWPLPKTTFHISTSDKQVSFMDDMDLKGAQIRRVVIFGDTENVTSWAEALGLIVENLFVKYGQFGAIIVDDDYISRYITKDAQSLLNPQDMEGTEYVVETGMNTNRKKKLLQEIGKKLNLDREDILFELSK